MTALSRIITEGHIFHTAIGEARKSNKIYSNFAIQNRPEIAQPRNSELRFYKWPMRHLQMYPMPNVNLKHLILRDILLRSLADSINLHAYHINAL